MMTRAQVITLHIAAALTAISGAVFAFMKYAMESDDPFAVVNHPLQPFVLSAHVVVAPLLVFAFGWIFGNHIAPGYSNPNVPKRKSGLFNVTVILPMIASGYLLQISTGDAARKAMAIAHWASSAFFVLAYVVHLLTRKNNSVEAPVSSPARTRDNHAGEDTGAPQSDLR